MIHLIDCISHYRI